MTSRSARKRSRIYLEYINRIYETTSESSGDDLAHSPPRVVRENLTTDSVEYEV